MDNMTKNDKNFFSVEDLKIEYTSGGEAIHAVNGISFELA